MIDGHYKARIDLFWNRIAQHFARLGLTPNQITWAGLVLVLADCGLYVWHRDSFWFGLTLALIFTLDSLDGAVARVTGRSSRYGGYLDAVVDRYQEIAVYAAVAAVTGYWLLCFAAVTGSLLTSYNKARTAVEATIDNENWPDLLERMERVVLVCTALVLDPFVRLPAALGVSFLYCMLAFIAVLTHVTAVQRFFRARRILTGGAARGG